MIYVAVIFGISSAIALSRGQKSPLIGAGGVLIAYLLQIPFASFDLTPLVAGITAVSIVGCFVFILPAKDRRTSNKISTIPYSALGYVCLILALIFGFAWLSELVLGINRPPTLVLALLLLTCYRSCAKMGEKQNLESAESLIRRYKKPPALLIRSFENDKRRTRPILGSILPFYPDSLGITFEQKLAHHMDQLGPFIALGDPEDYLPSFGAAKIYATDDQWQCKFQQLCKRAGFVLVLEGATAGLAWEISQVRAFCDPRRVFLIIPPAQFRWSNWADFSHLIHDAGFKIDRSDPGPGSVIGFNSKYEAEPMGTKAMSPRDIVKQIRISGIPMSKGVEHQKIDTMVSPSNSKNVELKLIESLEKLEPEKTIDHENLDEFLSNQDVKSSNEFLVDEDLDNWNMRSEFAKLFRDEMIASARKRVGTGLWLEPRLLGMLVIGITLAFWLGIRHLNSNSSPFQIGDRVMPRVDTVIEADSFPRLPLTVTKVSRNHLETDGGIVAVDDVLAIDQAEKYYSDILLTDSKNVQALVFRSVLYFLDGKFTKSQNDINEAIQVDSLDSSKYELRGMILAELGHHERAFADFDRAISLDSNSSSAYYSRGYAHDRLFQYRMAIRDYRKAIELDISDPLPHNNLAWIFSTCPDRKYRDGKLAIDHASHAVRLDGGKEGMYLDTLAAAHAEVGQFDLACKHVKQAITRTPADSALVQEYEERLALYIKAKPFRQPPEK